MAAQVEAVSEGKGGRGEKSDAGGERKPGDAVEAAEAKEDVGEVSSKSGVIGIYRHRAYIVYWNSYAVAICNARLRIPLPPHERRRLGGREA